MFGDRRASRPSRNALAALAAALVLSVLPVSASSAVSPDSTAGAANAATALSCPPGFESLPGCSGSGGSATASAWSQENLAGMSVNLYVPDSEPALAGKRALMINLHGCVQTAADMVAGANWTATADEYGMVVAAPAVPNGGVYMGCWDYYGTGHDRAAPGKHDDNLLDLVDALLAREELNIDADQVYISGLSSGGGQTMVMGCLAPDVFAGIGINAGPTVGTAASEISYVATTPDRARGVCENFGRAHAADFGTQLTSVVYGDNDGTVAPGYNVLNAEVMAAIYDASEISSFPLAGLPGTNTNGSGTLWSDADGPRVSLIQNTGLGHNWPAGGGPGGSFISTNSINYPAYITEFFFENNRRVQGSDDAVPPHVELTSPTDGATVEGTVRLAATASDDVGVTRVDFFVDGAGVGQATAPPYEVEWDSTGYGGERQITARARDAAGNTATSSVTVTVAGPAAPEQYCGTATNLEHKSAGRAYSYGVNPWNPYYAVGSGQYLGNGDATTSTLRETAEGRFETVASCD